MRFTVVIPTRERCDTLQSSLDTVLSQNRDDLVVVVSDNASTDGTRDVVAARRDPRIRYVNTGQRVSMASNWEFALRHVDDGENYVFYLGDDDALLPHALDDVEGIIRETGTRAVAWRKPDYHWPNWPFEHWRNLMVATVDNRLIRYESRRALRDVARLWLPYYRCPALYNSFVDVRAIRQAQRGETFFRSLIPDAYSGYAVLRVMDWYLYSTRPFSINGGSAHSTGASNGSAPGSNASPRKMFWAEADLPVHPRVLPVGGSVVLQVAEPLYQVNDVLFDGGLALNRPRLIGGFFREIQGSSAVQWRTAVDDLSAHARQHDDRALLTMIDLFGRAFPNRPVERRQSAPARGLTASRQLVVDLSEYGITNVADASAWLGKLLGPYQRPTTVRTYRSVDKVASRVGSWVSARVPDWTI